MLTPLFLILLVLSNVVSEERNKPCTTPNGESATCIPADSCKVITEAVSAKLPNAVEFAKKSQCGYDTKPLVCCGSTGRFEVITTTAATLSIDDFLSIFGPAPTAEELPPPLQYHDVKELPDRSICGLERTTTRIVGGETTELGEFPWTVALEYEHKDRKEEPSVKCGGSLINTKFVVTAAHCLFNLEFKLVRVRLGEWNLTSDPDCLNLNTANDECAEPIQLIKVKEKIPHPFYTAKPINNDIALLLLEEEVVFNNYTRPICLPPPNLPFPNVNTKMTVAGWGATEAYGAQSNIKLKLALPLRPNSECNKFLEQQVSPNQLCAGGEEKKDSCQGDSGGPLMRAYEDRGNKQTQWYLEGVVSHGVGCGIIGHPAVYTRLTRYIAWIINTISEE